MTTQELADLIGELLLAEAEEGEFCSELDGADVCVSTFREAGILTSDSGIEVCLGGPRDGRVFQLTVIEVRR